MTKEWNGGPVDSEHQDWIIQKAFWHNHKSIIAKAFQRHFLMSLTVDDFVMMDYKNEYPLGDSSKRPKFHVNFLMKDKLQFFRSIYLSDCIHNWNFPEKKAIFDTYFDKLSLILLTFYNKIEIVYMGEVHFDRKLDNLLNRIFIPKINISQDNIRMIGHDPRYNFLSHIQGNGGRINVINLFGGREIQHIQKFINIINTQVIPADLNIVINLDDTIDDIKRKLDLFSMYIY